MNPEAIEAAAEAYFEGIGDASYQDAIRMALEAAAPYLIRELALKQMVSMPWFEELVMAEALAYHSGGNCRFETEARAAELEAAAFGFMGDFITGDYNSTPQQVGDFLRDRAAAIRAGEA